MSVDWVIFAATMFGGTVPSDERESATGERVKRLVEWTCNNEACFQRGGMVSQGQYAPKPSCPRCDGPMEKHWEWVEAEPVVEALRDLAADHPLHTLARRKLDALLTQLESDTPRRNP